MTSLQERLFAMQDKQYAAFQAKLTLGKLRKAINNNPQGIAATVSGAPDKPCGVGRADANPKLLLNDT